MNLEEDSAAVKLEAAVQLNRPIQSYLNHTFKADQTATTTARDMLYVPPTDPFSADQRSAFDEALRHNFEIVSGSEGHKVVQSYLDMLLAYPRGMWSELQPNAATCFDVAIAMSVPSQMSGGASSLLMTSPSTRSWLIATPSSTQVQSDML